MATTIEFFKHDDAKKIKKLFWYLAGKVQNFMGPQSGCKCNIVKKKDSTLLSF